MRKRRACRRWLPHARLTWAPTPSGQMPNGSSETCTARTPNSTAASAGRRSTSPGRSPKWSPTTAAVHSPATPDPDMKAPRHRPLAEQYEQWMAYLRRQVVSRRTMTAVSVSARQAAAAAAASTGTIAGGFIVNGRHLAFGDDPRTQMWVGGQLFNL